MARHGSTKGREVEVMVVECVRGKERQRMVFSPQFGDDLEDGVLYGNAMEADGWKVEAWYMNVKCDGEGGRV